MNREKIFDKLFTDLTMQCIIYMRVLYVRFSQLIYMIAVYAYFR